MNAIPTTRYLLLEPNTAGFTIVFGFVIWLLYQYREQIDSCLLVAIAYTSFRIVFDLQFTRGRHAGFDLIPPLHELQNWKALFWLLIPLSLVSVSKDGIQNIGVVVFYVALLLTLIFKIFGAPISTPYRDIGLLYNGSMNPSLLAVGLPFMRNADRYLKFVLELIVAFLVFDSHQMTPFVVYLSICAARGFIFSIVFVGICELVLKGEGLAYRHLEGHFSDYVFFWNQFRENFSLWWGMGPNKFFIFGPQTQLMSNRPGGMMFFLHSDWLQLVLEFGVLGCIPWLWVYAKTMIKAYRTNRVIFESGIGMTAFMVSYFPLHASSTALFAILCLTVLKR